METFITIIHISVALFMILVVLIQGGNQGGIGAAFGGGNSQGVFGATGATSFLGKLTYGAAAVFMCTSLFLTVAQTDSSFVGSQSIRDQIKAQAELKDKSNATEQEVLKDDVKANKADTTSP